MHMMNSEEETQESEESNAGHSPGTWVKDSKLDSLQGADISETCVPKVTTGNGRMCRKGSITELFRHTLYPDGPSTSDGLFEYDLDQQPHW